MSDAKPVQSDPLEPPEMRTDAVRCPHCYPGGDDNCTLCNGTRYVTKCQAREWRISNPDAI